MVTEISLLDEVLAADMKLLRAKEADEILKAKEARAAARAAYQGYCMRQSRTLQYM
jgi:hypothetical protein